MKLPRLLKRMLQVLLLVVVLVCVLLAMLPALLSHDRAQVWLQGRVRQALEVGQEVSWDRVRLRWGGGQQVEGLVYREPGVDIAIDRVSIESGLLSFLKRDIQFGEIIIDRPVVVLALPSVEEDVEPAPDKPARAARSVSDRENPPTVAREMPAPREIREEVVKDVTPFQMPVEIRGAIVVQDGLLKVRDEAATQEMVWEDLQMRTAFLHGLRQPVSFQLTAKQEHATGTTDLALSGSVRVLQENGVFDPQALSAELDLVLQRLQIGNVAWIPHALADAPMVEGLLDTKFNVAIAGVDRVRVDFSADVTDPVVSGGALGKDRLEPGDIAVEVKAGWQDGSLQLELLRVDNALLQLGGEGSLVGNMEGDYPVGEMRLEMNADVARILMQLPETIPLHDGMELEEGNLAARFSLRSDGTSMDVDAVLELLQVQARQQEQVLVFEDLLKTEFSLQLSPSGPELKNLVLQTGFADVQGKGTLDAFRLLVDVDLDAAREMAGQFVDLGSQLLEGRVSIEGMLESKDSAVRSIQVTAESSGIRFGASPEQVFSVSTVRLQSSGDVHFAKDGFTPLRATGLRAVLQSDPVKVSASAADLDLTTVPPGLPSGSLQWDIDFEKIQSILVSAGMLGDDMQVTGQFRGATAISLQDSMLSFSPFEGNLSGVKVVTPEVSFKEPSLTMQWSLAMTLPPAPLDLVLTNGEMASDSFALRLPEVRYAVGANGLGILDLKDAILTADLGGLMPLIQTATGAPIEVGGDSITTFSWKGPIDPAWENIVREGEGAAEVRVPRVKAYGMLATNVVTTMRAGEGRIHLALDTSANEGRVRMQPVIDVTGEEPLLVMPADSHVIQNVNLTDEMATELLALVHPLLRGSSVLGGIVNLTLETCRVPLSEAGVQGADLRGRFTLLDLELEPRGPLLEIMDAARVRSQKVHVAEQQIAFVVEGGRIHPSPLALVAAGHELSLAGSVGLDASLDYRVLVPISAELVGRDAYRHLQGQTLGLPIRGTVIRPEIARDAFAQAIASMVKDAATDAIREEGREAVRDLQERGEDALRDILRRRR